MMDPAQSSKEYLTDSYVALKEPQKKKANKVYKQKYNRQMGERY